VSLKVMTWVLEHSAATLSDRLVLLALADNANDDEHNAFPSLPTIAKKARVSVRTARYSLRQLEQMGSIRKVGEHSSGTTIWHIPTPEPGTADIAGGANSAGRQSAESAPEPFSSGGGREATTTGSPAESAAQAKVRECLALFDGLAVDPLKLEIGIGNALGAYPHKNIMRACRALLNWVTGPEPPDLARANLNSALMKIISEQDPDPADHPQHNTTTAAIAIGDRECPECDGMRHILGDDNVARPCPRCHPSVARAA
jgi:hypothetical protein